MHKLLYPLLITGTAALIIGCSDHSKTLPKTTPLKSSIGKTATESAPKPSSDTKKSAVSGPHGSPKGHPPMSGPRFKVPEGWTRIKSSGFRYATLTTGQGAEKVEIAISKLRGTAGGVLMNVNRWRGQIGLKQPIAAPALDTLGYKVKVKGAEAVVFDLKGQNARMLVAIVPRPTVTWFFKLMAKDALAEKHKTAFERVVHSLEFK